jgi:ABC-type sugar transport system permease subunit
VTLTFTGLAVGLVVGLGILMALLLNEAFPGRGFVRTVALVP